ncbi:hypothetical protein [Nocardia altamirensis]|uniref:hypothetical protein n=1 Tax=Nocardia altamirensis TaxID=472158 RepID=UPI00114D34D3|nr:hypothetical protein [Nocardia altamirensis]
MSHPITSTREGVVIGAVAAALVLTLLFCPGRVACSSYSGDRPCVDSRILLDGIAVVHAGRRGLLRVDGPSGCGRAARVVVSLGWCGAGALRIR